jgi:hypothetical protein
MPMYDPGTLYVDPILTGFSVGYRDQTLFGERVFPEIPVRTASGRYRVFDRSDWLHYPDRREPGTVANEIRGRKWSEDTFHTVEHSLQAAVADEEDQELNSLGGLANAAFGGALQINPHADATRLVTRSILLGHEKKAADTIRNTANYPIDNTVTLAGNQQWDQDWASGTSSVSNPVADIRTAIRVITNLTGVPPNLMLIPTLGLPFVDQHPRIVDRFKTFTLAAPDAFRTLTGFEGEIVPVNSRYNAADNVDDTENITEFWGKDVWIGIVTPGLGENQISFGKTFSQVYPDGSIRPTDRWREEARKSDLVRVSQKYDLKIVSSIAGYLIKNAFSSGAW